MGADYAIICRVSKSILVIGKAREIWPHSKAEPRLDAALRIPRIAKWVNDVTTGPVEFIYAESGGDWNKAGLIEAHPDWRCFSAWDGWEDLGYEHWPIHPV